MFVDSTDPTWNRIGAFMKHYNYIDSEVAFAKLRSGYVYFQARLYYNAWHMSVSACPSVRPFVCVSVIQNGRCKQRRANSVDLYYFNEIKENWSLAREKFHGGSPVLHISRIAISCILATCLHEVTKFAWTGVITIIINAVIMSFRLQNVNWLTDRQIARITI